MSENEWALTVSLIAALAWLPALLSVWEIYCKKADLKLKPFGYQVMHGEFNEKQCCLHAFTFNAISLHKNYTFKDVKIKVKYKGIAEVYEGDWVWPREYKMITTDGKVIELKVFPENTIPFIGTFKPNTTITTHLIFTTGLNSNVYIEGFEFIKLTFIDYKNKEKEFVIDYKDYPESKIVFDERIWKEVQI